MEKCVKMENLKIIFIGPGGVGKTTLRKIFFDQENPFDLIQQTLEPTYGVETNFYTMGRTVAIHDLAGQQINDWLNEPEEIFVGSDLILIILDSREDKHENLKFCMKVNKIRNEFCQDSKLIAFFHKVDLISDSKQHELDNFIFDSFPAKNRINAYKTSINKDHFLKTFKIFANEVKKLTNSTETENYNIILRKMEILNEFFTKQEIDLNSLIKKIDGTSVKVVEVITDLKEKGILQVNSEKNIVCISPKGQDIIDSMKKNLYHKIHEKIAPDKDFLKGIILAEARGRTFLTFESDPMYFSKMFPGQEAESDTASTLISMFFSAIGDFGTQINEGGTSSINLSNDKSQILSINTKDIFCIVFLTDINIDMSVTNILKQFVREINQELEKEIKFFIESGALNKFQEYEPTFISKLKRVNDDLKTLKDLSQGLSQESLFSLYNNLTNQTLQKSDYQILKNLIFQQILREQQNVIEEINKK
jgi:GTPase SAR1 family protein